MSHRPPILDRVRAAGHVVFDGGDCDANLVCDRARDRSGTYPDRMHLAYRLAREWVAWTWACRSLPHERYLLEPLRADGTPGLEAGQHRGAYTLGLHDGDPALVPTRPLPVRRDRDRDAVFDDLGPVVLASGIRIHDGPYVAGCLGMPGLHLEALLAALVPCWARWGPLVSLTVLEE